MRGILIALAIAYPLTAHIAITTGNQPLMLVSFALLATPVLLPGLLRGTLAAWLATLGVVAGLVLLGREQLAWLPLYAPPVFINLLMAWLFGRTLIAGRVPVIERIARALHAPGEPLDAAIPPYARRLTLGWTVLFVLLACSSLALALCATPGGLLLLLGVRPPLTVPREVWSLFANLGNYLIVAAFFLIEYAWRRRRFPRQPYTGMLDFLRRTAAIGPRLLDRGHEDT